MTPRIATKNEKTIAKSMRAIADKLEAGELRLDPSVRPLGVTHAPGNKMTISRIEYRLQLLVPVDLAEVTND